MVERTASGSAKGHVVLVDDDASVRKSVCTLLQREGYQVSVYDSAQALLQQLVFDAPSVILTDMRMPGESGVDLQAQLKTLGHELPMVFASGESRHEGIIAAMKHGAVDFLLKPFSAQALLDALQRAMHVAQTQWMQTQKATRVSHLLKRLTPRELEICHWMVRGYSNQQIATVDGAAAATIKLHRARVMEKMQASTLPELMHLLEGVALPSPVLNAGESRGLD